MADIVSPADLARVGLGLADGPKAIPKAAPVRSPAAPAAPPAASAEAPKVAAPMTWDEVLSHPEMKNLSGEQLEAARREYFTDVIVPQIPTDQVKGAWESFDADTSPSILAQVKRGASRLLSMGKGADAVAQPASTAPAMSAPAEIPAGDAPAPTAAQPAPPAQPPVPPVPNQPPVVSPPVAGQPAAVVPSQSPQVGPDGHMQHSVAPDVQAARDAERMKILQSELEANPTDEALKREIAFEQAKGGQSASNADLHAPAVEVTGHYEPPTPEEQAQMDAEDRAKGAPLRTPVAPPDTDKLIAAYSIHNNVSHDIAASEIAGIQAEANRRIDKGEDPELVQDWASKRYATPMGSVRASTGRSVSDYLLGLASGTATLLATPGGLANALTGGGYDAVLKSIFGKSGTQMATDIDGYLSGRMSDQTLSEKYGLAGEKGGVNVATKLLQNPKLLAQVGIESAPSTLGLLGITRGAVVKAYQTAYEGAIAAGRSQATAASIAREAATNAGEKANIVANGLMGAGQNALQTKQQVMAMPEPDLENSPIYAWLRKYVNAETAREVTANLAAEPSAVIAGFGDALATKFSGAGKSEAQIMGGKSIREKIEAFRRAPTPEAIGSIVGPMANEAKEEFLQSGPSEQGGQNVGIKLAANPDQSLTDQVMEQGALGATLAVGQTGAMHVAGALVKPLSKAAAASEQARVEPSMGAEPEVKGKEANVSSMPASPEGQAEPVINPPTITAEGAAADKGQLFHDVDEPTLKTIPNVDSAQEPAPAKASEAVAAVEDKNAPIPAEELLGQPDLPAPAPKLAPGVPLAEPEYRSELESMAKNAGWEETGGRMVRDAEGNITGRTSWIPKEEWWPERPDKLNPKQVQEAVRKALAGEPLKAAEKRTIDFMLDSARHRIESSKSLSEVDLPINEQNLADHGLVERAAAIDEDAVERLSIQYPDDDAAFMAGIQGIIHGNESAKTGAGGETVARTQGGGESKAEVAPAQTGQEVKVYNSRLPALGQAAQATKRTGQKHEAVPHPTDAGKWIVRAASPTQASNERRSDSARRKAVAEMTHEELRQALLTSEATGLGNRRAYEEAVKKPVQVSIDADSLKWVNDNMGHETGDALLRLIGTALADEKADAFHLSGDEFALQANGIDEATTVMDAVRDRLSKAVLEFTAPDGRIITLNGIGVSYGAGKTLSEADQYLRADKEQRTQSGERSGRGLAPPRAVEKPAAGLKTDQGNAAAKEVAPELVRAKADLDEALGDLGQLFRKVAGTKNLIPEVDEKQLVPILTRLFDAAFRLGYHKFKDAARFALDTIRDKLGKDVVEAITIDHLQGAYIGMRGKHAGAESAKAVANVESLDEITGKAQTEPEVFTLPMMNRGADWKGVPSGQLEIQKFGDKWAYGLSLNTNSEGYGHAAKESEATFATRDEALSAAVGQGLKWGGSKGDELHERHVARIREWLNKLAPATTVDVGAHAAATSPKNDLAQPTQAQKEAGNYAKGHVRIAGLDVTIENPVGSTRSGTDSNGKPWSIKMRSHYGYIRGTIGSDREQMDIFIKAGTPLEYDGPAFVIDQRKPGNGHFDEHKVMLGYASQAEAEDAYKVNFTKDWEGHKATTTFTLPEFKEWLNRGDTTAPAAASVKESASASEVVADWVAKRLHDGDKFTSRELFDQSDKAFKGTQAAGTYTPKDAYDAMELGVNRFIKVNPNTGDPVMAMEGLQKLIDLLPTQTKRTQEMDEFQQFSTPPTHSYLASWVANIKPGETVLEPSAGIGGLAVFAKNAGAQVVVNEFSARRAAVLKTLGFRTFTENAEQLNNILPDDVKPTVVLMNPPFSATAGRMQGMRNTSNGAVHIEQALKRLQPGGRLVAIVGEGMGADKPGFKAWWKKIAEEYNVRANIGISGESYAKYGTTFDNQILVIDKTGPTPLVSGSDKMRGAKSPTVTGQVATPAEALPLLEGVRNERSGSSQQSADQPVGKAGVAQAGSRAGSNGAVPVSTDVPGTAQQSVEPAGKVGTEQPAGQSRGARPGKSGASPDADGQRGRSNQRAGATGASPGGSSAVSGERVAQPGISGTEPGVSPGVVVSAKEAEKTKGELTDAVFEEYRPQLLHIPGANKHPSALVQSAAMASVLPPVPTYQPNLPRNIATRTDGLGLSEAGMEAVVYAGQAHQQFLSDGSRRGFFIGDGTGVGKGREVAGIILDNLNSGRKKAIWISEKQGLMNDAKRDLRGVGGDPGVLFNQNSTKAPDAIKGDKGVLFTTYNTLRGAEKANVNEDKKQIKTRLQQIIDWAGPDFEGVIAFDEAHNMANAQAQKGKRGVREASKQALAGIELQKKLPKARVVYVSATGATEVSNLAYAERLGLWGQGTPFPTAAAFTQSIEAAGVSAMELVSRDMKSLGSYISRQLSYDGVTYGRIEHELTPLQTDIYNELAKAWQVVLDRIDTAMELSGSKKNGRARSAALAAFWGNHQRFFNQIITAMQMPSVLEQMHKDIAKGDSPVLQMVNTNEATQARQLAGMDEDDSLEDLDLTPRDQLIQYVQNGFPVQQFEEYLDDKGNKQSRPAVDSTGEPVLNREAISMRDQLIENLHAIRVPDGPLEMLLNTFGPDMVAEVTGRKERVYRGTDENGDKAMVREKRGKAAAAADAEAFINDKKRILIFSDAGGTGFSYHADKTKPNQRHRSHYLVQPGWRADKAVQGLGRTHRTNQVSAPHIWLPTTNLKAQKRFISSIARRLDQLGALTKGQRQAASQGIFQAKDNLESSYAYAAVRQLFTDLLHGHSENDMTFAQMEKALGLNGMIDPDTGALRDEKIPGVPQFLNRLLSLTTDMQDKVFDMFFSRMEHLIDLAAQHGTLDSGLQTLRALKVRKLSDEVVHKEPRSGAETRYVRLETTHDNKTYPLDGVLRSIDEGYKQELVGKFRYFRAGPRDGQPFIVVASGTKTDEKGNVSKNYRAYTPEGVHYGIKEASFDKDHALPTESAELAAAWKDALEKAPKTFTQTDHLFTGAILPVWDRMPVDHVQVVRTVTEDGERLLGRWIASRQVNDILKNLGLSPVAKLTPQEIHDTIIKEGLKVKLANGWLLEPRTVAGQTRIEVDLNTTYPSNTLLNEIRSYGGFVERIAFHERAFIPVDNIEALTKLLATRPAADVVGKKKDDTVFSRVRGAGMSTDDVNAAVAPIKAAAKNLPPVNVLASTKQAPDELRSDIRKSGADGDTAGAFHAGQIYLFADQLRDPEHAQAVLLHEATHFGLRGLFGPEIDPVLMQIWMTNPDIRKQASERVTKFDLSRVKAVEEVLADMGGQRIQPTVWQSLVAFVRDWLRRNGFTAKFVKGLNDADVARIVQRAGEYWKTGKGTQSTHLYRDTALSRNPKPFFFHGDRAEYTGVKREMHGAMFHEVKLVEGHLKGQSKWTQTAPTFELEGETPAQIKAKEQAAAKAEADANKEPAGKKVKADQVDLFNQQGTLFSRNSAATLAAGGLRRRPRTGLLDTAMRVAGGELVGKHVTGPLYDKLLQWGGELIPEHVKAGVVSDYGLPDAYIDRRTEMRARQQMLASQTKTVVGKLAALNRAESRLAYQWMNTKPDAGAEAHLMSQLPAESRDLLQMLKSDITDLGREAVRLGQLSPEAFERNSMAYLHRTYAKYELDPKSSRQSMANRKAAVKILGEQYKGRGLRDDVTMGAIKAGNPDWWERSVKDDKADVSLKGKKFVRLEDRAPVDTTTEPLAGMDQSQRLGKLKTVAYVPVGETVPARYAGWRQDGIWEARFFDKAGKVGMWRDFTPLERDRMGELDEVRFGVAKTLLMMSRDVEVGRFLEWIADNHSKATDAGLSNVIEASESNLQAYKADTWVQVPTSKIPGTDALAYGKLAGRYVPGPVWNDIRQFMRRDAGMFGAYQSMLRAWKISKTALSPAVHMNNVMANFIMADAHDVRARDVVRAVGVMLSKDADQAKLLDRFRNSGATQGMFTNHELRREILEPLMKELKAELGRLDETPAMLRISQIVNLAFHGELRQAVAAAGQTKGARLAASLTNAMMKGYAAEDEVFRLATFIKATEDGATDLEAGKLARKAFLDYDINAPWIQAMRRTAFPFIAFSYRAIPMMLNTAAHKPWKLAKWMLVATALNSLAYTMLGLTGADEDKERALLPEEKDGKIFGIFPKLMRMPWNNHRDPVFLDIRRWIPVGDVVDFGQWHSAIPIPSTLMPGGPLVMLGEIMANRSLFTGKDITKQTDTLVEKGMKVGDYAFKSFLPNIPVIPFTYSADTIMNAATGRTDPFGREYSVPQALASSVGIKLATYPKDELTRNVVLDFKAKDKEIEGNMHQLEREFARKGINRDKFDKELGYQNAKRQALIDETRKKIDGAR